MALLATSLLLSACTTPPARVEGAPQAQLASWRGRLAIRIDNGPAQSEPQSFSAGFELSGNPQAGELTLYTPLGTTAAALSWSARTAVMRSQGEVREFTSLEALISEAVGTELPVAALFAWLSGEPLSVAGWRADLTRYGEGRITALRTAPAPRAELRLVLDQ